MKKFLSILALLLMHLSAEEWQACAEGMGEVRLLHELPRMRPFNYT